MGANMCKNCGKPLQGKDQKTFCSISCSSKFNKGIQRNKPKGKCKVCSIAIPNKWIYCRSCKPAPILTLADVFALPSLRDKHPSWKYSYIRTRCRSQNKHLQGLPCQVCGYTAHVELAHIQSITSFSNDTPLSTVNSPDNLLVLCPNHHWEFDAGLLSLKDIPTR